MFNHLMLTSLLIFTLPGAPPAATPSSREPAVAADLAAEGGEEPSIELPPDLVRVLSDYEKAWQDRDTAALAALFTEDGFVLPNGRPPVRGRDGIRRHYADSGGPLALRALAFATGGSVGYIIGGYARERTGPDIGKFTLTLRRESGGRWLIVSDMDSPNRR